MSTTWGKDKKMAPKMPVTNQTYFQLDEPAIRVAIETTASTICIGLPNFRKSLEEWPPAARASKFVWYPKLDMKTAEAPSMTV